MTKTRRIVCVLLLSLLPAVALSAAVFADATITLPQTVSGPVGAFVQVPATSSGPVVRWYAVDPGLNLFPVNLLKDTKVAVVTSPNAGAYRLMAWTADNSGPSEAATCTVQIGAAPPPGPTP